MAYVIRKGRKFFLAESKRTPRGPRQKCSYIGSGPLKCRTLAALKYHLIELNATEDAKRRVLYTRLGQIVEAADGVIDNCRQRRDWQAACRRHLKAVVRLKRITARIDRIIRAMVKLGMVTHFDWSDRAESRSITRKMAKLLRH